MKHITIDKADTVATVVERVIAAPDAEITIVIPRDAVFKKSGENFELLKREAAAAGKTLRVESVDHDVLKLAEAGGLGASHPLFAGSGTILSDIVPAGGMAPVPSRRAPARTARKMMPQSAAKQSGEARKLTVPAEDGDEEEHMEEGAPEADRDGGGEEYGEMLVSGGGKPRRGRRVFFGVVLAVVLVLLGAWGFGAVFGRADVVLAFKKTPWSFDAALSGSKAATGVNVSTKTIPVEVFRTARTTTQLYPASGRATVSEKARGKIFVYNAYSSAPQTLVATTRFVTPDGKIFRIERQIIVPGAEIKDSKIVPASIETDVIAEKPGAEYNLGAVDHLSVPGFQGSPKYEGFYGSLKSASGGFVGERAVPTEKDIAAAKEKVSEILRAGLREQTAPSRPSGFVVPEGASDIVVTKITANSRTDEQGNFSVFGQAELREIGFREGDVRGLLIGIASAEDGRLTVADIAIRYSGVKPDFGKGTLNMSVAADGMLTSAFADGAFRESVAGKTLAEARAAVTSLYGLTNARIALKPFWLRVLPADLDRIRVRVD